MAANSFGLFIQQLNAADDELKVKVVQIIFDLLMVQDIPELVSKTMAVSGLSCSLRDFDAKATW
jgi:condensin complex subunit 3